MMDCRFTISKSSISAWEEIRNCVHSIAIVASESSARCKVSHRARDDETTCRVLLELSTVEEDTDWP